MILYVSNNRRRTLRFTGVLHTSEKCAGRGPGDRQAHVANPSELSDPNRLCKRCGGGQSD